MEAKRYSRQRELIYQCLCSTKEHPTAEMVYATLKPDNPKLSLGTVYRNLNQLCEMGSITRMPFPVERYDADTTPHGHFCCDDCGRVYDLEVPNTDEEGKQLCARAGFAFRLETRLFYGVCADCLRRDAVV